MSFVYQYYLLHLYRIFYLCFSARIEDDDPGYEQDNWMERKKESEEEEILRADRWYYKNMDRERDNPEQSGQL